MEEILSKSDLMARFKRFHADSRRGISLPLFSEMCGVSMRQLYRVFVKETDPMSLEVQIRVSRALMAHQRGQIRVMENPLSKKRKAEYRPRGEEKPRMVKAISFTIKNGKISLSPGVVNRQDFSRPSLDEMIGD